MFRKTTILLLTLALTLGATASVFGQDASPAVYLPLVNAGAQNSVTADRQVDAQADPEADLTDTVDDVEAASSQDGAVFVSTNAQDEIRGNEIVMYRRAGDGQLTLTGRFPTGGQGLGAGLGSQGAVLLSKNGHWLFAVNGGSDEISVFAVYPTGLVLTDKVASGGDRPTSLTVYKNLVYVLNAGDPGSITAFKLQRDGRLTPIPDSTRFLSNNGTGAAPGPAQVSFTPNGDALVVTEKATNLIATYTVQRNGRATGPSLTNSSGAVPFGFAFGRRDTLVVSEAAASAASSYKVDAGTAQLISGSVANGQAAACWIVIANNGKYAYTTNAGSASLSLYQVEENGALTLLNARAGETGAGTGPTDAAASRHERYIYALSPRSQNVIAFAVEADGSLTALGSFGGLPLNAAGVAAW